MYTSKVARGGRFGAFSIRGENMGMAQPSLQIVAYGNGRPSKKSVPSAAGFTLLELIIAATILSLLCGLAQPVASVVIRRHKERTLRCNLQKIREAIDRYQEASLAGRFVKAPSYGYPPNLEALVSPIELAGGKKLQLMREIPIDPFTGNRDWGVHSMEDDPDSDSWDGDQIWNVYSKAQGTAVDGTRYRDW